jgi:hypothetical protein
MAGRDPVLIDFGLARLAEDPRLTMTGYLLGTPGYLAPETLFGDPATAATDVHGWAATVVYAAQGDPPYGRGHAMAVLDRTRRGEASLTGVPAPLLPLLRACLAVEPLDRPTVAEAMAALDSPATAVVPVHHAVPKPAEPPTRPYTVVAPMPQPSSPVPQPLPPPPSRIAPTPQQRPVPPPPGAFQPGTAPTRPDGAARFRRTAALLAVLAGIAVASGAAPYLTLVAVGLGVLALTGLSRTQEASWRRRYARGVRWSDAPRSVLGYPWHLLAGSFGAALNVAVAAGFAGCTAVGMLVLGSTGAEALTVGGAVGGWTTWWGPGSRRVRQPLGRAADLATRRSLPGWTVVAALALGVVVLWLATAGEPVTWAPASGPPWQGLSDALRAMWPSGI